MPKKRNYIVARSESRHPEAFDHLSHSAHVRILALLWSEEILRFLLELTDADNLENLVLLDVILNSEGRLIEIRENSDVRAYPNITIGPQEDIKEVDIRVVLVMGNELDEILYKLYVGSNYLSKAYHAGETEFVVNISSQGRLQHYSQNPANAPLELYEDNE